MTLSLNAYRKTNGSEVDRTLQIKNLGDTINTEYPEYAPLIPAEENFILFTSRRKMISGNKTDATNDYFEDMYISERKDKKWLPPKMLDTIIILPCTMQNGFISDGEKLLYTKQVKI